eukprot:gnl/MRDRNA2_/MRDRNA2_228064_c0_seq1.p1 gnl/MRDRNA2_/MRDRNA2_228064_c0~~gnl/MRDRNA2_/MRDRNA2_228064_c0_seq1.p1  ORF type:complete len:756 (+),score=109.36 gnl/MRDRNA2_/MRDRNA2_228064_c0_seq1:247-2268(+)
MPHVDGPSGPAENKEPDNSSSFSMARSPMSESSVAEDVPGIDVREDLQNSRMNSPSPSPSNRQSLQNSKSRPSLSRASVSRLKVDAPNTQAGNIELQIVSAKGLRAADVHCCGAVALSDPYVKVLLGEEHRRKEVFRTHTRKRTLDPVWNAYCKFNTTPDQQQIILELWDQDHLNSDDLLGRVNLKLADVRSAGGTLERWFDVEAQEDCQNATGKILLTATLANYKKGGDLHDRFDLLADEPLEQDEDENKDANTTLARLQDVVNNFKFDAFFCACIVFNAVCMSASLELEGRRAGESIGLAEPVSSSLQGLDSTIESLDILFTILFTVELSIRLVAFRYKFIIRAANWLDILVVATSVFEVFGAKLVDLTFLRLIRLTRLARLLRIILLSSFCNPLRILMKSIQTGISALFWSFLLLCMIELFAALLMTQMVAEVITDENQDLDMRKFIYKYYGTTSRSALSMFEMTMAPGAWGRLGRPLIEEINAAYAWFFVIYVGGVTFAIIRIISALFLRDTLQVANGDEHLMKNEKMKGLRKYSEDIREVFRKADTNGTGDISLEQFQRLMTDPQVMAWLSVLDLNPRNASYIFELFDNGDGRLTLDEFLSGVFRLRGAAQQVDMVLLQRDTQYVRSKLDHLGKQLLDLSHDFSKRPSVSHIQRSDPVPVKNSQWTEI